MVTTRFRANSFSSTLLLILTFTSSRVRPISLITGSTCAWHAGESRFCVLQNALEVWLSCTVRGQRAPGDQTGMSALASPCDTESYRLLDMQRMCLEHVLQLQGRCPAEDRLVGQALSNSSLVKALMSVWAMRHGLGV